jgi:DNA-binding IclR family transcriptional regulator
MSATTRDVELAVAASTTLSNQQDRSPSGTQVVDRVFDILEAFLAEGPELTVTEVAHAVRLKYATAHRLLEVMARRGVLARDRESRRYRIGYWLQQFGSLGHHDLASAHAYLEILTEKTGETSHIAVLVDSAAVYIDTVAGSRLLSAHRHVGRRMPLHSTGVGKALLFDRPWAEVNRLLPTPLSRFTDRTILERAQLRAELNMARCNGYAIDRGETEVGLVCVAAPVRDRSGEIIAAVSVGGPATRVEQQLESLAEKVVACAAELSVDLGWVARGAESGRHMEEPT